ncbi:MAG: hypothetical protein REI11_03240, partial [Patulibacter sp.]|nr:hypothetical protein [Patulibacter sp.]
MFTSSGLTAFVPTADLDAADAFYGGTLALPRIDASPFANVYDSDGTQLRVTEGGELEAAAQTERPGLERVGRRGAAVRGEHLVGV